MLQMCMDQNFFLYGMIAAGNSGSMVPVLEQPLLSHSGKKI